MGADRFETSSCISAIAIDLTIFSENVSHDLEAFAKHAGRSTINTSDVLLLARRNEGLEDVLKQEAKAVKARDKV